MNLISTYNMKCFDKNNSGKNKYSILDKVGSHDTFEILKEFIDHNIDEFKVIDKSKQVYSFKNITFNKKSRLIYGWLRTGYFGSKNDIIDIDTGDIDFKKTMKNAEIVDHFVFFFIPKGFDVAVSLLHSIRGRGIKTLFFDLFKKYFKDKTQLILQVNPITYSNAMDNWKNATTKEIRLIKFTAVNDVADNILGHHKKDVIMKQSVTSNFGIFSDFLNPLSEQSQLIEQITPFCEEVKTVVEIDGRKKIFTIGSPLDEEVIGIDFPDDIFDEGNPPHDRILEFCLEITNDFSKKLYQGMSVSC